MFQLDIFLVCYIMLPEGVIILLSSACYDDSPEPLPESLMQQTAGAVILVFDMICWAEPAMTQRCAAVLLERGTGCAALGTKQSEGIIQEWYKWNLFFFCSSVRSGLPISSPQPVRLLSVCEMNSPWVCCCWTTNTIRKSDQQISSCQVNLTFLLCCLSEQRERGRDLKKWFVSVVWGTCQQIVQTGVRLVRVSVHLCGCVFTVSMCVCWLWIFWSLLLGPILVWMCYHINTGDRDKGVRINTL